MAVNKCSGTVEPDMPLQRRDGDQLLLHVQVWGLASYVSSANERLKNICLLANRERRSQLISHFRFPSRANVVSDFGFQLRAHVFRSFPKYLHAVGKQK